MSALSLMPAERRQERRSVTWAAECRHGGRILLGTVRDLSTEGAFFQPELDLTAGRFCDGDWSGLPEDAEVEVRLMHRATSDLHWFGTVRWTGTSTAHGCHGYGL